METDYDTGQLRYIKSPFLTALAHFPVTLLNTHTPARTKLYRRAQKKAVIILTGWASYTFIRQIIQLSVKNQPVRDTLELFLFSSSAFIAQFAATTKATPGDRAGLDACHRSPALCRIRQGAAHIRDKGFNRPRRANDKKANQKKVALLSSHTSSCRGTTSYCA